jgi:hypothetical protein
MRRLTDARNYILPYGLFQAVTIQLFCCSVKHRILPDSLYTPYSIVPHFSIPEVVNQMADVEKATDLGVYATAWPCSHQFHSRT